MAQMFGIDNGKTSSLLMIEHGLFLFYIENSSWLCSTRAREVKAEIDGTYFEIMALGVPKVRKVELIIFS